MATKKVGKSLHRVHAGMKSDWQHIPEHKRNFFQDIAAHTHGLITPANTITLLGMFLVFRGLFMFVGDSLITGFLFILFGRTMDLLDGIVADATKTKSFVGATLDETADMLQLAYGIVILAMAGVIPLAAAYLIGLPKFLNAVSSLSAKVRGKRMYPTKASKIGTAVIWTSILLFMMHELLIDTGFRFDLIGWVALCIALVLTVPSTAYYISVGLGSETQKD